MADFVETRKSRYVQSPQRIAVDLNPVQLLSENLSRRSFAVTNVGTTTIKINYGGIDPTQTAYHLSLAGGTAIDDGTGNKLLDEEFSGRVSAVSSVAGGLVAVMEVIS